MMVVHGMMDVTEERCKANERATTGDEITCVIDNIVGPSDNAPQRMMALRRAVGQH
jgi:hypothetical protein